MKIAIELIKVDEELRIRKEVGDLTSLEASIRDVGLINPVIIDENGYLLAGYRRLAACKNLGMVEIEVNVVDLQGDVMKKLDVEVAENFYRKDFTPEEILASEQRRREIIEASREKTLLERFWAWLKGLFSSKTDDTATSQTRVEEPLPTDEKSEEVEENTESTNEEGTEQDSEQPEKSEQINDSSLEKKPEQSEQDDASYPKQMRSETDDVIKWRTS